MMGYRDTILDLFPQARITSGYRGPNHPLTRKNPRSYHALGSPDSPRAFDVAPIPGVSFEDYVGKLRSAGLPIAEALDEAKNPTKHTTGPNWHVAFGDSKPMPRKPNYAAMSQPVNGLDPLAPEKLTDAPLGFMSAMAPAQTMQMPPLADLQAPHVKPKGKFNAGMLLGVLGDALAAYGGRQGVFAPMMMQQRADEREENRFARRLAAQAERDQQEALAAANKPYRFQNNNGDVVEINPATGDQRVLYADPAAKPDWQRSTDPNTGEISITPIPGGNRPNENHIRHLLSTGDKQNFDAKFGAGMADYYLRTFGGR